MYSLFLSLELTFEPMVDYIVGGHVRFNKRKGAALLKPVLLRFYSPAPPPPLPLAPELPPSSSSPLSTLCTSVEQEGKLYVIQIESRDEVMSGKAMPITFRLTTESEERILIHQVVLTHITRFVYGARVFHLPFDSILKSALADRQPKIPPLEKSHPVLETSWKIPWQCVPTLAALPISTTCVLEVSYVVVVKLKLREEIFDFSFSVAMRNEES